MISGINYVTGQPITIDMEDGLICSIKDYEGDEAIASLPYIAPGLVDLQINGYLGDDFNQLPLSEEMVLRFCKHMLELGVTRCYPTLITNSFEAILEALHVINKVCSTHSWVHHTIAGIHIEGPFISPLDGSRGAHDLQYVCAPNIDWVKSWQEASGGRVKIITFSPEWENSLSFIAYCKQEGIIASIGHTAAAPTQIEESAAAGVSMITHFGNGVQLQLPRHPNYLWQQLAEDELYACVIADGFHLPKQVLKVVMQVKGTKTILVSDAVSLSGAKPGRYTTFVGGEVVLDSAGKLSLAHNEQLLAGSVCMLTDGIKHLVGENIASLSLAWNMASIHPASLMKLPNKEGLSVGALADIVLFKIAPSSEIMIESTYVMGERFMANL